MKGRASRASRKTVSHADTTYIEEQSDDLSPMSTPHPSTFSPTELARMLEELQKELPKVSPSEKSSLELKGFDLKEVTSYADYCRMRDAIIARTGGNPETFDEGGRTTLNVDAAAIAGAKMVVDNARSTRAFSKKLVETAGVSEDDILYKGLPQKGAEGVAAMAINENRKASLFESMVDFQKQIQFKMNVLKHLDKEAAIRNKMHRQLSKSDGPETRKNKEEAAANKKGRKRAREDVDIAMLKTPKQSQELNPLDDKKIYDDYACNIASELREEQKKRRRTAPIPFNINLLDEGEGKEDEE